MLTLSSIEYCISNDRHRNSSRLFSTRQSKHSHHYKPGVISSKNLKYLYRIDNVDIHSQHNQPVTLRLNLLEILFFRIGSIQGSVSVKEVIHHQGSTNLIGTSSSKESISKLSRSWGKHRNAIFCIDSSLIQDQLIDVDATIKQIGTGFYTKIAEHEHALRILPISAVKEIKLIKEEQIIVNPLYIEPNPEVVDEFQSLLRKQLAFFECLYDEGKSMTSSQRQTQLTAIIEQTAEFFSARLGRENPFDMSLIEFCNCYGRSISNEQLRKYSSTNTVLDLLKSNADELFMENKHYSKLISQKDFRKALELANEENGYGSTRYSNSFD